MKGFKRGQFLLIISICSLMFVFWSSAYLGAQSSTKDWSWPRLIAISTVGAGGSAYPVTIGWGAILEKMTGTKVRVIPSETRAEHLRWTRQGEVDLSVDPLSDVAFGITAGTPENATKQGGPFQVRLVWQMTTNPFGWFVRGDSDIKTIFDIKPSVKGKRKLSFITGGAGQRDGLVALCHWIGIHPEKDVDMVPFGSYVACVKAVAEGKVDLTFASPVTAVLYEVEGNPHGIRWLDLPIEEDPKGRERYLNYKTTQIFTRFTEGVKSAHGVRGVIAPMWYITRSDTDKQLIYNLAKWLGENHDQYKNIHEAAKSHMTLNSVRATLDFIYMPIHEGTISYLKEKGIWTSADDARQKYNVNLVTRYVETYKDAINEAEKKKIEVSPTNQKWIEFWDNARKEIPAFRVSKEIPK